MRTGPIQALGVGLENFRCRTKALTPYSLVLLPPAKEGYVVYKSVPYGSVDDTLPYLMRRAQENQTVLQGIRKERDLLKKELFKRLTLRGGRS